MLELITSAASAITASGVVLGIIFAIYNWYLKNEKQEDAIKAIKEEQSVLTRGVLACLKGLKEQGCNGPVTDAIKDIESHLNEQAHK